MIRGSQAKNRSVLERQVEAAVGRCKSVPDGRRRKSQFSCRHTVRCGKCPQETAFAALVGRLDVVHAEAVTHTRNGAGNGKRTQADRQKYPLSFHVLSLPAKIAKVGFRALPTSADTPRFPRASSAGPKSLRRAEPQLLSVLPAGQSMAVHILEVCRRQNDALPSTAAFKHNFSGISIDSHHHLVGLRGTNFESELRLWRSLPLTALVPVFGVPRSDISFTGVLPRMWPWQSISRSMRTIACRFEDRVVRVLFPGSFRMRGACQTESHPVLAGVLATVVVRASRVEHEEPVADFGNAALAIPVDPV